MSNLAGRFYFKLTSNGNLLGEYSNNRSRSCSAESAERALELEGQVGGGAARFVGIYRSVWQEDGGVAHTAILKIDPKAGCDGIFTVYWSSPESDSFEGEAMLCDEILIGNYWLVDRPEQ